MKRPHLLRKQPPGWIVCIYRGFAPFELVCGRERDGPRGSRRGQKRPPSQLAAAGLEPEPGKRIWEHYGAGGTTAVVEMGLEDLIFPPLVLAHHPDGLSGDTRLRPGQAC